jgi:hypothetical protein
VIVINIAWVIGIVVAYVLLLVLVGTVAWAIGEMRLDQNRRYKNLLTGLNMLRNKLLELDPGADIPAVAEEAD